MSSTPTYPIQGISVQGSGPLPVRREINAWYSDRSRLGQLQVSLFMQAMVTFKSKPIEELLSFFQIAGELGALRVITVADFARNPLRTPRGMGW